MKKHIFLLLLLLGISSDIISQNTLMDFANEEPEQKVVKRDTIPLPNNNYEISLMDETMQIQSEIVLEGLGNKRIFDSALGFLAKWDAGKVRGVYTAYGIQWGECSIPTEGLLKVDENKFMFSFQTGVKFRPVGTTANYYYIFDIVVGVKDNRMSFLIYNCKRTYSQFGSDGYTKSFEELYGSSKLSGKKKRELAEFNSLISDFINKLHHRVLEDDKPYPINHWNEIRNHSIKVGMNVIECLLSWGQPREKNNSIFEHSYTDQWIYANDYVHFENGKITSIMDK